MFPEIIGVKRQLEIGLQTQVQWCAPHLIHT